MKRLALFIANGLNVFLAVAVSAATYSVADLGLLTDLPGRSDSRPNAISNNGKVAGANVVNGAYRAFLHDGAWTNLGTLGGNESIAADVDDSGVTVGLSKVTNDITRAFIWTPGGKDGVAGNPQMKALGTLGGTNSEAYAINSSGQIAGYAQTITTDHALRYDNGTFTDIGALLGGGLTYSYGLSINEAGRVAGIAYNASFTVSHAFFYDGSSAMDIGHLGGGQASALAINDNNQIAGYSSVTNGFDHAFRHVGGVMTDLGTLGGDYSYAVAINNSNVIVGGSFIDGDNSIYHAFVCVSNALVDLNGLLDGSGAGWILIEARAINDAGQIVGIGSFGGMNHAFLLNPLPSAPAAPLITDLMLNGTDVLISFTTVAGAEYAVERRSDFGGGDWGNAITGITGTGDVVTVTNSGTAGMASQFYRIRRSDP